MGTLIIPRTKCMKKGLRFFFRAAAAPDSARPTTLCCSTPSGWEYAAHALLLHSTSQEWVVISLSPWVTAMNTSTFYLLHESAISAFFFIQRHTEKNDKWDNLTRKTWDSCWNQTPDWLCVYTASLEFSSLYVSVTRSQSSLPVSVPMTPLLPQDRDPSFIWAKLHSLTADWETDSDETTAG